MAKLPTKTKIIVKDLPKLMPLGFFLGLVFFLWRGLSLDPHALPASSINMSLPAFEIPLLGEQGKLQSGVLNGKFRLLNIWASWCDSCAEEQPFLMKLAKSGVLMVGINYKDDPSQAQAWLKTWGNPYQEVGIDNTGRLALELGVYGTPETFLISPEGKLIYRHAGVMTEAVWQKEFLPRMKEGEGSQPRYESLLKELRCLVCQNQDLLDSHAALAMDLKQQVAQLMAAGKTDEEIRNDLVQRYGEFILFKPLVKSTTWVLWFGPGVLLLIGLGGLGLWVARSRFNA